MSTITAGSLGSVTPNYQSASPSYALLPAGPGSGANANGESDEKLVQSRSREGGKEDIDTNVVIVTPTLPSNTRNGDTRTSRTSPHSPFSASASTSSALGRFFAFFNWRATRSSVQAKNQNKSSGGGGGGLDLEKGGGGGGGGKSARPVRLFAPVYGGLGAGLSICECFYGFLF